MDSADKKKSTSHHTVSTPIRLLHEPPMSSAIENNNNSLIDGSTALHRTGASHYQASSGDTHNWWNLQASDASRSKQLAILRRNLSQCGIVAVLNRVDGIIPVGVVCNSSFFYSLCVSGTLLDAIGALFISVGEN